MTPEVNYQTDLSGVDWERLTETLADDNFNNGRSPAQLEESFRNSHAAVLATNAGRIIGTARVLSDGVCNAYIVDVWTLTSFRHQGIASRMMEILLDRLPGQHVYLFTEDAVEFYETLGFEPRGVGMGRVVGKWLENH